MNELLMAGFVRGRGIPMVRCATVPLRVPANSELVIEGFVRTDAGEIDWVPDGAEPLGPGAAIEGPFGDHTGWYSMPDRYPLVEVTAITRRRDAIFPATVVGPPPQEDYYMGKAVERIFLPLLQLLMPDLVDYHLPMFGAFHNVAIVGIRKAWPLQARRIMHAIWGAGQMSWTKVLIVVDETVDVHDQGAVLAALCARCHPVRDVETVRGPLDILDHASPALGAGGKIGFDATRRLPGEDACGVPWDLPVARPDPAAVRAEAEALTGTHRITATAVPERGSGRLLLLAVDKAAAGQGAAAIEAAFHRVPGAGLVLAVDTSVDVAALETALFHVMANMDPSRDLLRREDRLGIDATPKRPGDERHGGSVRPWPPVMALDETVLRRLAGRAEELGLA